MVFVLFEKNSGAIFTNKHINITNCVFVTVEYITICLQLCPPATPQHQIEHCNSIYLYFTLCNKNFKVEPILVLGEQWIYDTGRTSLQRRLNRDIEIIHRKDTYINQRQNYSPSKIWWTAG